LQALQGINDDKAQQIEDQQGDGITCPVHLVCIADAGQPVQATLDRAQPTDE
jgi:hypothetical protein